MAFVVEGLSDIALDSDTAGYQVSVLTKISQVKELANEWRAFLAETGIENISLRFEWVETFLHYFPQEKLCVIALHDTKGCLVAIAPFAINRGHIRASQRLLRYVRFLGSKEFLYDWMQLPVLPNAEKTMVIRQIVDVLFQMERDWDVLDFQSFLGKDELEEFEKELKRYGGIIEIEKAEAMPKMALPSTIAEYEADRDKKRVHRDVKRFTKKLMEQVQETPVLKMLASSDMETDLNQFFLQHTEYWLAKTGSSNFKNYPQLADFYKAILKNCCQASDYPHMAFSMLSAGEVTLSYQLGVWYSWGYINYMNNYNQEYKAFRTGILHMDCMVRESISKGTQVFSFGQGEEGYKSLWANDYDELWHFRYFKTPLIQWVWQFDFALKAFTNRWLPKRIDARKNKDAQ